VRLRHRIEKASAAKQRKQRKDAKNVQNPSATGHHDANFYIEPTMEVEAEEGPWNTESFPVQRQNPCGNRGEKTVKSGTGTITPGSCQSEKKRGKR
jgi:hypothetical protein